MKILYNLLWLIIMTINVYGQIGDTLKIDLPIVIDTNKKDVKYEMEEFPEYEAIDFRFYNYEHISINDSVFSGHFEIQLHYEKNNELSEFKNGKYYFNGVRVAVYRFYYKSLFRKINEKIFNNAIKSTKDSYNQVSDIKNKLIYTFDEEEGYIFIKRIQE